MFKYLFFLALIKPKSLNKTQYVDKALYQELSNYILLYTRNYEILEMEGRFPSSIPQEYVVSIAVYWQRWRCLQHSAEKALFQWLLMFYRFVMYVSLILMSTNQYQSYNV